MTYRSNYEAHGVTYGSVGGTQVPDLMRYPPKGYRPFESRVRLGVGDNRFELACHQLESFEIQKRAGFTVTDRDENDDVVMTRRLLGLFPIHLPVRVVYEIDEPLRVGYAYGTLPGHPLSGEEAFLVDYEQDGSVWLTIRYFSRPSNAFWWIVSPVLRLVQARYNRRYLRALLPD